MLLIVDMDGTCCDVLRRLEIAGPQPVKDDKQAFTKWIETLQNPEEMLKDEPIPFMALTLKTLSRDPNVHMVYLTSRNERYREATLQWINMNDFPARPLYMRQDGDWSHTRDHKKKVLQHLVKIYGKTGIAIDDDFSNEVMEVYRELGIVHFQVHQGKKRAF